MDGTRAVAVIIGAQIWCPAADVTVGQMRKVFLKYMADHPEQLHVKDGVMATLALRQAFPCNR